MQFDVIVGNPPYQDTAGAGSQLWPAFVKLALDSLKDKGAMSFIHPSTWRVFQSKSKMWDVIASQNVTHIQMYTKEKTNELFGGNASIATDAYVLTKEAYKGRTTITDISDTTYLTDLSKETFLLNKQFTFLENVLDLKNKQEYIHIKEINRDYVKQTSQADYSVKTIKSLTKDGPTFSYIKNSEGKACQLGVSKVLISTSGNSANEIYSLYDKNGDYAVNKDKVMSVKVIDDEHAKLVIEFFNHKEFLENRDAIIFSTFLMDHKLLKHADLSKPTLKALLNG